MAIIRYGGLKVGVPDGTNPALALWIGQLVRPEELFPLARLRWPGSIFGAPILEQTQPPWRPVTLNSLYWPPDASRFAHAHVVVDDNTLKQIRAQAFAGQSYQPLPFIMDDGYYGSPVQTKLWMLPARKLQTGLTTATAGSDLYLLTLVDDRYFWWETSLQYAIVPFVTQWTDLYTDIGAALGVSIAADAINPIYATPVAAYAASYRPTPLVLDAVAWSVGQRIVRRLDGTVHAQNAATALANQAQQETIYAMRKRRGGVFDLTAPPDLSALLPAKIEVVYPAPGTQASFAADLTSLAELRLPQIPQPAVAGQPWTKILHRYESLYHPLTKQAATDWLLWQLGNNDQWYAGTAPWVTDGLAEVEWRQQGGEVTTHVRRGVYNPQEDLLPLPASLILPILPPPPPPPPPPPCTDIEYVLDQRDQCDYPIMNRYVRTLVYECGVLQFPIPTFTNTGQVGCCGCFESGSGQSGTPNCCCAQFSLCVAWPFADDFQMIEGLTLKPLYPQSGICQWQFVGVLNGQQATVNAFWYGCGVAVGDPGFLVVTVECLHGGQWASYIASAPVLAGGCFDPTNLLIGTWDGGENDCAGLGTPAPFIHIVEGPGPCFIDSGSGTVSGVVCPQPPTLCAYVPAGIYGNCNCANGAFVTLASQGGFDYAGTLTLFGCPGTPTLFIYAMYRNDGNTWELQIEITGCNGDTGVQTFYGQSKGNCLAGLPECVAIAAPNNCCGPITGNLYYCLQVTGGSGLIPPIGSVICQQGLPTWKVGNGVTFGGPGEFVDANVLSGPFSDPTCAGGCQPLSGSGIIIVPFADTTPPPGGPGQPGVPGTPGGDGFSVCVTAGPCGISGSGSIITPRYWCVAETASGSGPAVSCSAGVVLTINATSTGGTTCAPGNFALSWNPGTQLWEGTDQSGAFWSLACNGSKQFVHQSPSQWTGGAPFTLPATITYTGAGGCTGQTTTITWSASSGGGSGGSGGGGGGTTTAYVCVAESALTGTIAINGAVTVAGGGSGTIVGGPYATPVCDNQCPPTTGSGIIPPPCCGWSPLPTGFPQPPPAVWVTFGAGLKSLGSIELLLVANAGLSWQAVGVSTQCGYANVGLRCDPNTGAFILSGYLQDANFAEYVQFAATGVGMCNPFVVKFSGVTIRIGKGLPSTHIGCGVAPDGGGQEWIATATD